MKQLLAPLATAALLLTGCGSPSQAPAATSAAPLAIPATATPQQLASIITENEASWREYEDNIVDCALADVMGEGALDEVKVMTCRTAASTVTLMANNAARSMRALSAPPADMKDLVARTLVALDTLGASGADESCGSDRESDACDNDSTIANGAIRPVISVLDAWKPYTG